MARRVPLSDTATAIKCIREEGCVILTGFSTIEDVEKVNADAKPHTKVLGDTSLEAQAGRCYRLFGRSTTVREVWLQQPAVLHIINYFLRTESVPYNDQDSWVMKTDAILSVASTLDIGPGVKAQTLHRDDHIWQQTHKRTDENEYQIGSDVAMGLLVPGIKTTAENGATLVVPRSHLWDHSRQARMEDAVPAEMTVSEALLFLGSTAHAGGANLSLQHRTVHGFFYCRSWLRPEENQHLWWTRKEVRQWSIGAQKQAGYVLGNPFIGHCDETNPLDVCREGDIHKQQSSMFPSGTTEFSHNAAPQDRKRFDFQHTWFDDYVRPTWEAHTSHLHGKQLSILEIGCFEGASTTWFLDNLMSHPSSKMTAIDTFEGGMEHQDPDQTHKYDLGSLEQRFKSNIAKCAHSNRLTIMKMSSDEALLKLRQNSESFDFIYIDASHVAIDVLHDAVLCWRMLSVGGTILFDDFCWKGYMEDCFNPRIAIQSFLHSAAPEVDANEIEYQMWATKVPKKFEATPNPDPDLLYRESDECSKGPSVPNLHN